MSGPLRPNPFANPRSSPASGSAGGPSGVVWGAALAAAAGSSPVPLAPLDAAASGSEGASAIFEGPGSGGGSRLMDLLPGGHFDAALPGALGGGDALAPAASWGGQSGAASSADFAGVARRVQREHLLEAAAVGAWVDAPSRLEEWAALDCVAVSGAGAGTGGATAPCLPVVPAPLCWLVACGLWLAGWPALLVCCRCLPAADACLQVVALPALVKAALMVAPCAEAAGLM